VQARAQGAAGARVGLAERAQRSWATLLVATVVVLAALVAAYRWGTPWLAQQVARFVPLEVEQSLTRTALAELERRNFRASELDAQRRARLTARFDALTTSALADAALRPYDAYRPPYRLEFRSTSMPKLPGLRLGANALAFPGGLVVVTDDLVRLADERGLGDDAVVGVLAHEVGHVAHRHGTRMVIAQGVIGGFFGLALGDVSNLLVTGAALLQGLSYSRAHELQADCFAVRLLARMATPTAPMADLLEAMGRPEPTSPESRASAPVAAASAHLQGADAADWFSTHPATATRAANLRSGQVEGCAR
jgi:Zn-dependent protease with chaperone function